FVGGAALTRKFTATRISVEYGGPTIYAKDAMDGLDLANRLFGATTREAMLERLRAEQEGLRAGAEAADAAGAPPPGRRGRALGRLADGADPEPARSRSPRAPAGAPRPRPPLSQPPNAPGQASRGEGLSAAAPRRGRPENPRHPRRGGELGAGGGRAWVAGGQRSLSLLRSALLRRRFDRLCGREGGGALPLPPSARRRASLSRRLRAGRRLRRARLRGDVRRHLRDGRARARRALEGGGAVSALPRHPGPRHRARRGPRRDAPREAPYAVGLPRFAGPGHGRPPQGPLPRSTGIVRLPGLPEPRRPAHPIRPAPPRADRDRPDRRLYDGSRGLGVGPRLPSPRGQVLQGRVTCRSPRAFSPCSKRRAWRRSGSSTLAADRADSPAGSRPGSSTPSASIATRARSARHAGSPRRRGSAISSFTRRTSSARSTRPGSPSSSPRTSVPPMPSWSGRGGRSRRATAWAWSRSTSTSGGKRAR